MRKYGLDWWGMVVCWRLSLLTKYLMSPCLPMKMVSWIDDRILHRWCLLKFYDTWTLRLDIVLHGRWAKLCYGEKESEA